MRDVLLFVRKLSGWPGLEGNLNRLRPEPPYFSVLFTSSQVEGTPIRTYSGRYLATASFDYSVQFFGAGAVEVAQLFKNRADTGVYDFEPGFTYVSTSMIERLDEEISSSFRERAIMSLRVRRTKEIIMNSDPFDSTSVIVNVGDTEEQIDISGVASGP